jgi:hypothetical protein
LRQQKLPYGKNRSVHTDATCRQSLFVRSHSNNDDSTSQHQLTKVRDKQQQQSMFQRQLEQLDERQHRLLEAIESGVIELDEITQKRMQQIKISRDALRIELANIDQYQQLDLEPIRASQIDKLSDLLKTKLLNGNREIAKKLFEDFGGRNLDN